MVSNLRHIDLNYDGTHSQESALALIFDLVPEWNNSKDTIEFIRFTDGITNTLMKAVNKRPGMTPEEIDDDSILLRAYGNGTDLLIDRDRECSSHSLLASHHLAPPLLARFNNGLLYRFIRGRVCQPEDLRTPDIWRGVASRLGEWHSTLPTAAILQEGGHEPSTAMKYAKISDLKSPNIWEVMDWWVSNVPETNEKQKARKALLKEELAWMIDQLGDIPGMDGQPRLVFGHCDLLSANVIVTEPSPVRAAAASFDPSAPHSPRSSSAGSPSPSAEASAVASVSHEDSDDEMSVASGEEKAVSFIDYEYATPCPAAFDIANHFAEWGGFDCDFSVLPTQSQRRDFLRQYILAHESLKGLSRADPKIVEAQKKQLDQLMSQVDAFRGAPGFYWGVWALIQAEISQIDFDYANYAEIRLGEYFAWKDAVLGTAHKDVPLRERRWAQD